MYSRAEEDVINYLNMGLCNKEIADRLFVTEKTVKFHLTSIYKKAGVSSRAEFIAQRWGSQATRPQPIKEERMSQGNNLGGGSRPINPAGLEQGARTVQVVHKTQEQKVQFIDETFKVSDTITHLHKMMKDVTKEEITPNTVNAACNCVARLNETINTAIQAAKFLNER